MAAGGRPAPGAPGPPLEPGVRILKSLGFKEAVSYTHLTLPTKA